MGVTKEKSPSLRPGLTAPIKGLHVHGLSAEPAYAVEPAKDAVGKEASRAEQALMETGLIDQPEAPWFSAVAKLAAQTTGFAMGGVSLVQSHRHVFAGTSGFSDREIERETSLCAVATQHPHEPLLVEDARNDPRFSSMRLVAGESGLRAYAGVPLVLSDGAVVGALCVLDTTPRGLSPRQLEDLVRLSVVTSELLDAARRATRLHSVVDRLTLSELAARSSEQQLRLVFTNAATALAVLRADGVFVRVNEAFAHLLGTTTSRLLGRSARDVTRPDDQTSNAGLLETGLHETRLRHADGKLVPALVKTSAIPVAENELLVLWQVESVLERRSAERELLESRPGVDGIVSIDADGQVIGWSRGAEHMFGHPADAMLGRPLDRILPGEQRERHRAWLRRAAEGRSEPAGGVPVALPAIRADGEHLHVEVTMTRWTQQGRPGVTGVVRDVTERHRAQLSSELLAEAARYANDAETLRQAAVPVLEDICRRFGWPAALAWTDDAAPGSWAVVPHEHASGAGCALAALAGAGAHPDRFQLPTDGRTRLVTDPRQLVMPEIQDAVRACGVDGGVSVPVMARGEVAGNLVFYLPAGAPSPGPWVLEVLSQVGLLLGRVTERESTAALLGHQARHDALTGLANRRTLLERVSAVQRSVGAGEHEGRAAVFVLDVDRFKLINDSLGHGAGDLVLQEVAHRLAGVVGSGDLVARQGGDEFVVLAPRLSQSPDAVTAYAQALHDAVTGPFSVVGQDVAVRVSVGACLLRIEHALTPDQPVVLLRDADAALLRAKRRGAGRVEVFDAALRQDAAARLVDENALGETILLGGLRLHHQPVVDLASGLATGTEALVRWPRAGHGLVLPDRFIPMAEESGLIVELGRWVLRQACLDAMAWSTLVPSLAKGTVSVNVSARQLDHPRFAQDVADALHESGLPSSRLVLEITESVLVEDGSPALEVLRRLREDGVRLALDDFGTGFSSLGYVQRMPVDILKIDKSFVDLITGPGQGTAFSEVVLKLAEATGLSTTAEGVENVEQARALDALGCRTGQGWLWSKAVPLDQLAAALPHTTLSSR